MSKIFRKLFSTDAAAGFKTIYALSSGQMRAGVAVIRVSGPNAKHVLMSMTKSSSLVSRQMFYTPIRHPKSKELIDKGLAVWFPGPSTFTGEDSCEFHVHGGCAVVNDLLQALGSIENCQPAEPGQFTKRALFNGKLDLTAVEGLADLLNAETSAQRKLALRQTSGHLRNLYDDWRGRLLKCVAHVEAFIDFGEEEQIDHGTMDNVNSQVCGIRNEIRRHISDSRAGELLRNGVHVAIVGRPNVGKSSLFNILCQREAAIVTHMPGTTRDVLQVHFNIGGYPVILLDTAGIRSTEDVVEREGVKRARDILRIADVLVMVVDIPTCSGSSSIQSGVVRQLEECVVGSDEACEPSDPNGLREIDTYLPEIVVLLNKIDLLPSNVNEKNACQFVAWKNKVIPVHGISCLTKRGLDGFLERMTTLVANMCDKSLTAENAVFTHQRHRHLVTQAANEIDMFFDYCQRSEIVLAAECLRAALRSLGKLTGHVTTEEILDVVFRDFCIGK